MDKNQSGMQLIRVGAYTAVGTLLVYAAAATAMGVYNARRKAQPSTSTTTPCGCGTK